ncbi:MAG: penicillin-binding protein 2 [Paraglaciecola sp.]|jgi:penicillin-binding protein 2
MRSRALIIRAFVVLTILILASRLFYIQVIETKYREAAQANILHKVVEYPYRGMVYDRNGKLLIQNDPVFDILIIPKELELADSTKICELFELDHTDFLDKYQRARKYSRILPSLFIEQLSNLEFASIQDKLINLNGFLVQPRTVRSYSHASLANVMGYVAEVTPRQLNRDTTGYYKPGDNIGITGLEKSFEDQLRGSRGVSYKTVDVRGTIIGSFDEGEHDNKSIPGNNLTLTIDLDLQQYAEKLMKGKIGSLVALDPKTGEVLAFVSSPSYDPNLLSGRKYGESFTEIASDTLKPLFARPIQATYPPGSMFKTVQSLIALQEQVITQSEQVFCEGNLIGDLAPPGKYDVKKAITYSSNNFFYIIFKRMIQQGLEKSPFIDSRIGFEKWQKHVQDFGLGVRLGIDIPNENSGQIPSLRTYDGIYGENRWKFSNIYSLSIGQGEILVTPLQMANLGALLANKGSYITPHVVKSIDGKPVNNIAEHRVDIDSRHFPIVLDGMKQVIEIGSGRRAFISDIEICGKTSTVQNPHGEDHSGFMGFAPMSDPKIAIAVYVENAGWGGRAAASTASLVMEKYIRGSITKTWTENYVLKGDFADARRTN